MHIEISLKFDFSFCTSLWSFSGDPYPVWWRLTQAYETLHLKHIHLFIAFWMGFPRVIFLHYPFRRVHRYNITNPNIPNFFCLVYLPYKGNDTILSADCLIDLFNFAWTPTLTPRLSFISKGLFQLYPLQLHKVRNCIRSLFFPLDRKRSYDTLKRS